MSREKTTINIYEAKGYKNRKEYLKELAFDFDVPFSVVSSLASVLGKSEDFDGLVNELEDMVC